MIRRQKIASIEAQLDSALQKLADNRVEAFYPTQIGFPRMRKLDGAVIMVKRGATIVGLERNLQGRKYVGPYYVIHGDVEAFYALTEDDSNDNPGYDFSKWSGTVLSFLERYE